MSGPSKTALSAAGRKLASDLSSQIDEEQGREDLGQG
jgi:hypothetical protein